MGPKAKAPKGPETPVRDSLVAFHADQMDLTAARLSLQIEQGSYVLPELEGYVREEAALFRWMALQIRGLLPK
jgi:hypothetical protein